MLAKPGMRKVARAAHWTIEQLERRVLLAVTPVWDQEGPGPVTGGNNRIAEAIRPISGGIQSIAAHPFNAGIAFVGTVNGGVWRSENATIASPTWKPLTDNRRSLSIGSIAISRFDADGKALTATTALNKLVVYAGIAKVSSGSFDGGPRLGLLKSIDGGGKWKSLSVKQFWNMDVVSVVPSLQDKNVVLVAAKSTTSSRAGVYRSTNGGASFERVLKGDARDVVADPGNTGRFYATIRGKGVFRGTNGGTTWQAVNTGLDLNSDTIDNDRASGADDGKEDAEGADRIRLAVHNSTSGNVVYAALISKPPRDRVMGIFRSTNQGATWTQMAGNFPDLSPGFQGDKHFSMVADPDDPDVVFVAGDRQVSAPFVSTIWRGDAAAATIWGSVVLAQADPDGAGAKVGTAPHADSRAMVFNAVGDLLEGDDGGIYRLINPNGDTSPGSVPRAWDSRNGDLLTLEFNSAAYDSVNDAFFGGTQDNGVPEQPSGGGKNWAINPTHTGDGGIVHVRNDHGANTSTRYTADQRFGDFTRRTFNNSGVVTNTTQMPLAVNGTGATPRTLLGPGMLLNSSGARVFDNTIQFEQLFVLNETQAGRMLIGTNYLYESLDDGATITALGGLNNLTDNGVNEDGDGNTGLDHDEWRPTLNLGRITAMAYGGRSGGVENDDVAYVAAGSRLWFRQTRNPASTLMGDFTQKTAYREAPIRGGAILDIALDPGEWKRGYVVDDKGHVFKFENTGSAAGDWKRITGNLKSKMTDIRSVEVIEAPDAPEKVIVVVAGQRGVWATRNPSAGGNAVWTKVSTGLPDVVINEVRYDRDVDMLYVATFGRGVWSTLNFRNTFAPPPAAAASAAVAPATGPSVMSVVEPDASEPGVLEISGDDAGATDDSIRIALDPDDSRTLNVFVNNTSDAPDFSIDADALTKVVINGLEGNDTLLVDHANGLIEFPEGIEFDEAGPGTNVRQDVNLTPIPAGAVSAIRDGLQGIADWADKIGQFAEAAQDIPAIGANLAESLSIGDGSSPIGGVLRQGFVGRILSYLATDVTPTIQEMVQTIKSVSDAVGKVLLGVDPDTVAGGLYQSTGGGQEIRFDLALALQAVKEVRLDLGAQAESLGLSFDASATADLAVNFDLAFSLGFDLTPGLSAAEAFFIRVDDLALTGRIRAGEIQVKDPDGLVDDLVLGAESPGPGLNFGVTVGFLEAAVTGGTLDVDARLSAEVINPDDDPAGNITLSELAGTTIDGLIDLTASGTLAAHLPMEVSLGGVVSGTPRITVTSTDLFGSAPTVTPEGFDELLNFNNIGPQDILNLLTQLGTYLGQFSDSSVFQTVIPFTNGTTLGDAIDLGTAFTQNVTNFLKKTDGSPGYAGAAELGLKLAEALGVPVDIVHPSYDTATNLLTYRVEFSKLFNVLDDAPLAFGFDLSPLAGLQTAATFDLNADLDVGLTFGIDLSPPASGVTLAQRFFIEDATASGHLVLSANDITATANLAFIEVGTSGGTATVDGTVALALKDPDPASTSTRLTLVDLLDNIVAHPLDLLVGGAPTITGSASLALNNITVSGIPGVSAAPGAHVSVTIADLKNPGAALVNVDGLGDLANFDHLSLADIIGALRGAVDFLRNLGDGTAFGSFLSTELPVLNTSVSDLLDYADTFAARVQAFESNPAGSLQGIEAAIEGAFSLDPADFSIAISGKNLLFDLHFDFDYGSGPVPFGIDLASLAASMPDGTAKTALLAASSLVQVSGSGTVGVVADANLDLVIGIDFTDKLAPRPFLGDETNLSLTARASASGVNFDVNIGPLGAFVRSGSATVDASNAPGNDERMSFTVDLVGKQYFSDLLTLDSTRVAVALTGAAEINLPLFFPDDATPLGGPAPANALNISIGDLNDPGTTLAVTTPDFAAAFGSFDFLNNLGAVVDGIDFLLQKLQQALNSKVLNAKLPLLGDKLKDAGQFIEDFRGIVVSKLQAELAGGGTVGAIQRALFDSIGPGPGGLGLLTLDPTLNDEGADGVADTVPNFADVPVAITGTDRVEFDLHLAKALTALSIPINFDLGIPGLGLTVTPPSAVTVQLGFDFDMGFGISRDEGFYLKTGAADELDVNLDVTIPGFHAQGNLAFLQVDVQDQVPHDVNGDGTDEPYTQATRLSGSFAVDLADPIGSNNRLTFADLSAAPVGNILSATFTAGADVNLRLAASFGGSGVFPSILTDFALAWDFASASTTAGASFGGTPGISFNNVRIDLGTFFSRLVGPVLGKIKEITNPVQPLVDILTARLPVLSDIDAARDFLDDNGDGKVTLLELAENPTLASVAPQLGFITATVRLLNLISRVSGVAGAAGGLEIALGSFDLGSLDLRAGGIPSGFDPSAHPVGTVASVASQIASLGGSVKSFFDDMATVPSGGGSSGLQFPILQSPSNAFNLLLGKSADLFLFDMPPLELGVGMDLFFPLLGPLGVQLSGSLGAKADFAFGFDSTGIQQAFSTRNPAHVFNGFFVSDRINANGTGEDVPEVVLTGRIEAFGALNVVIASAGVGGGLTANINLNLNDPNNDGKVRADEIDANLPLCVFDVSGQLKAGLSAFVKIGFGWFSRTKRFNIAEVVLLDFSYECEEQQPAPVLAQFTSTGILRLNIGAAAAARLHGDTTDGDEVFIVNHLGGTAGSEKVSVTAFGFTQEFSGVSRIDANAGEGNDSITFIGVLAASNMQGGNGNDVLAAGDGAAVLRGGEGNDQLSSGAGADQLFGHGGDDTVSGGAGNDLLEGGDGHDVIDAAGGNDTARGGAGDDSIDTGDGNDLIEAGDGNDDVDAGAGADTARGGAGNDTLIGGDDADRLEGGDGDDALVGEAGNDVLFGGAGNDRADGGDGADSIDGGADHDTLEGAAGNDTLTGGAGNDLIHGGDGADSLSGNAGNDQMFGEAGADTLNGNEDNDLLDGGADNDSLFGGTGNDTLRGADGADSLFGEAGADRIFGEAGNDTALGGEGDDSIEGGAGADSLLGGAGNDTVRGQQDADRIFGEAGNDLLFGDGGADFISGGDDHDEAHGGSENDTIDGNAGNDNLFGDAGDDLIHGNDGTDTARGNAGNDAVFGDADGDVLFGDADGDVLFGDAGDDLLEGGGAGDEMHGNDGNDRMIGGSSSPVDLDGDDTMFGGAGDDVMIGDDGALSATIPPGVTLLGGDGADVMSGGDGADLMYGQGGNDTMAGDAGIDVMFGNDADDVMTGDADDDYMEGNAGNDQMSGGAGEDDMIGGSSVSGTPDGNDAMDGGAGADVMLGDNGTIARDLLAGNVWRRHPAPFADVARNVTLLDGGAGTFGDDTMAGAAGDDILHGRSGDDVMTGGDGDDEMFGELGADDMLGDGGHDMMLGDSGAVTRLLNTDGSPTLNPNGSWKKSVLLAQPLDGGNDTIGGGSGDDAMFGGAADDTMAGDEGDDYLEGNSGADTMSGGTGEDDMVGGSSDLSVPDAVDRADGADFMEGGDDHDVMAGDNARIVRRIDPATNTFLRYTPGVTPGTGVGPENNAMIRDVYLLELDTVGGADLMSGNGDDDIMFGGLGDDLMSGNDGNDDMTGHLGADSMDGGAGSDGIVGDKGTIVTDLLDGSGSRLIQTNDSFMSEWIDVAGTLKRYVTLDDITNGGADTITGGTGDDFIHGGAANDLISGNDGDDALFGDIGDDVIFGGAGADHLWGGSGNDRLDGEWGADTAYGGAGDDWLKADVAEDRLVDWFGNFNDFVVPHASYGARTIIRLPSPQLRQYLLDLAAGDGATNPDQEAVIVTPPSHDDSGPGGRTR